jgi:hypothetical protein
MDTKTSSWVGIVVLILIILFIGATVVEAVSTACCADPYLRVHEFELSDGTPCVAAIVVPEEFPTVQGVSCNWTEVDGE